MTYNDIRKAMTKEINSNLENYLDESNCFNCTKLAENIYNETADSDDESDIPEEFFDVAFEMHEKLRKAGKINE